MANIKSAQKRVVSGQKKAVANKSAKSELKTELKKGKLAIESGSADMDATVKNTIKAVDQAAAKGHIAKNTAARRKSSLMKAVNAKKAAK
ncbi:MAG TPA: 30S ribosomal protein S20 [Oscillospiraceae bacterium]|nr:30S ribosomal protein S20 [Oscillospiraceae bacterium]HPS34975.1 30S ribosomal protein S20 [Oscillospiraceae bacterium]